MESQLERAAGQKLATQSGEKGGCSPHLSVWGRCLVEKSILLSVLC